MRGLKICLWIAGIGCLLGVFVMFLPCRVVESLVNVFGGQLCPDCPLCLYALRTVSAACVGIGVFFVILALNPMKYGVMIPFTGLSAVFLGIVCGIAGVMVGMPPVWYLSDSLSCAVLGVLILVFWRQAKRTYRH